MKASRASGAACVHSIDLLVGVLIYLAGPMRSDREKDCTSQERLSLMVIAPSARGALTPLPLSQEIALDIRACVFHLILLECTFLHHHAAEMVILQCL